jgi:hypothetical protein
MVIWEIEVFSIDLLVINKLIETIKLSLKAKKLTLIIKFLFFYIHNDFFLLLYKI